jgi:MFS superfamily sulfate permease-like transporter
MFQFPTFALSLMVIAVIVVGKRFAPRIPVALVAVVGAIVDDHHLGLEDIEPIAISAYIEELSAEIAKPSVKQHLGAIRQLFDYLVTGGVLVSTPAGSVRGPKFVVTRGKPPVRLCQVIGF